MQPGRDACSTLAEPGVVERATFAEISGRIDRLARVLDGLGVEPGERIGTFAWNNQRHFELYFAIPCLGAVLHTLNIRLFEEQLTYIVNHAEDRVIFVDDSLVPVLEKLAPSFATVEHYVVMGDGDAGSLPNALRYEELLEQAGRRRASTTRRSTSARRRRSATRAARPATRRACSTRTARSACTRRRRSSRTASACVAPTACWRSCRCSTPTPGACRTARRWPAPT